MLYYCYSTSFKVWFTAQDIEYTKHFMQLETTLTRCEKVERRFHTMDVSYVQIEQASGYG